MLVDANLVHTGAAVNKPRPFEVRGFEKKSHAPVLKRYCTYKAALRLAADLKNGEIYSWLEYKTVYPN
jgi:hypothetical protein